MSGYDFSLAPDDMAGAEEVSTETVSLGTDEESDWLSEIGRGLRVVVSKVPAGYSAYKTSDGDLTKKSLDVLYATGLYGPGASEAAPGHVAQRAAAPWWHKLVLPAIGVGAVGLWLATRRRR